jgi:phage tail sheath gpL-like
MSSPNISFDTIPSSIRKPGTYFEFNLKLAVRTLPSNKSRLLVLGQRLASGAAPSGLPFRVFSDDDAATYFGRGSMLHIMLKAAIKANRYAEIEAVGIDDAVGSAAASGTVTFSGTATDTGVATVKVAGRQVQVAVLAGQTAANVAANILPQLVAQADWPVTSAAAGGVVTMTVKNKGWGVTSGLVFEGAITAPGMAVATVQPNGGAVDPDITNTLAALFSSADEIIVTPYADQSNLTALRTHINDRSGSLEQRGCVGVYASRGTLSAATTLAGQINSGRMVSVLLPGTSTSAYELAAAFAAVVAFEEDPAMPLNTLALPGVLPPNLASRLGRTEQEVCLANGVTPIEVGPGETVQIVRAVTTYTTNPAGITDISLLNLMTIRTLDYVRKACRERIALRFPRSKLSNRTPPKVRSELLDVLHKLEELEIVENVEALKDDLIVERDSQDPDRLNARIPCDVVNGLHVFAGRIDLLL